MRLNRDKWEFIDHESKPIINAKEVVYWKNNLKKLLKIGMEFEYNLPEKNGMCKGDSNACPCIKMETDTCWEECINVNKCNTEKEYDKCINQCINCYPEDCEACSHYEYECNGVYCSDYVPKCFDCEDFTTDCEACPNKYDPEKNPENIRKKVIDELAPNNCYGYINESGVHSITTDGSLLGKKGIEIVTIGRRVDYWEFYKMAKNIIDNVTSKGAYLNERCSIHMHLLASYYGKLFPGGEGGNYGIPENISELERPMPKIILANFHQLLRRYQNALTWMGMGLDEPERMTRWEKFRVSVLTISAVMNDMRWVQNEVARNSGGNKYGFVNYKFCDFNLDGDLVRFHIEMRNLDGMDSPSVVAAFGCMYYALLIKAIEISRHGVVEVGDQKWLDYAREAKESILNNMKGYQDGDRFGNTSNLHNYTTYMIEESLDLVRQLKHILIKIGPAYQILEQLAERPVSYRRCDGKSWEEIENELSVPVTTEGVFETIINEYIDLRFVDSCKDKEEWITAVGEALRDDPHTEIEKTEDLEDRIKDYINEKQQDGDLIWSNTLGTAVLL